MFKTAIDWEANGFIVIGEAANCKHAIGLVEKLSPNLVLLDINMPDDDGFSIAQKILETDIKTKIIVITGYDRFEYAKKAIGFGVHDYLLKPVLDTELLQSIQSVRQKILEEQQNEQIMTQLTDDIFTLLPLVAPDNMQVLRSKTTEQVIKESENRENVVEKTIQYVQENLSNPDLTVENVSQALYVNVSYLSHIFKKIQGKGLKEYIISQRMERAYEYILRTNKSQMEVAKSVGYQDTVYFSRHLKKYFGLAFLQIRNIRKKYEK